MFETRAPLAYAALAYLIGATLGLIALPLLLLGWTPRLKPLISLCLIAAGIGGLAGHLEARRRAAPRAPLDDPIIGLITALRIEGDGTYAQLSPHAAPSQEIMIKRPGPPPPGLAVGAEALTFGPLRAPTPALNPGDLDGEAWAARRGAFAWSRGGLHLLKPASAWRRALVEARLTARRRLEALPHPVGAGLLAGLLLGDARAVDAGAVEALRQSGTGHLLAVSGLHVGGLAAVTFALLSLLIRRSCTRPDLWASGGAILAAWALVILAQLPLSARRAGLMVTLYLLGRALGRRPAPLNLLGAAALVIMGATPSLAQEPGFQLSFGAVLALITAAPRGKGPWIGAVAVAVVASAATAPIQALHFGLITPISPIANLILAPLAASILVPLGALGLLIAPLTSAPLTAAAIGAEILYAMAEVFASWAPPRVIGAHMAPLLAAPLVWLWLWRRRPRRAPALGLALTLILAAWSGARAPKGLRLEVIAVGQGEAILLHGPDAAVLLDAGPDSKARAILTHLRYLGVDRLDALILSHHHADHRGGLKAILGATRVDRLLHHGRAPLGILSGPQPEAVEGHQRLILGELRLDLWGGAAATASENDASLIIRAEGPKQAAWLVGDIEAAGEQRLLAQGPLPAAILKAPHHGSRTSSSAALLDALAPQAALISVGAGNHFGAPSPEVLARYAARGCAAWRTDEDGRLRAWLDEAPLRVEGHRR
ncbi:DNA internalization-related competence protein ComEC/Rec2 [Myxococcota bacterium]|nr:DNA internalization-related competence protein ComEC/Rec2 [Myxococcota bacterium]